MPTLAYFLARFSEPSSYAGLGAVLALIGLDLPDPALGQVAQLLAGGCGLLALFLKERGVVTAILLALLVAPGLSACAAAPAAILGGSSAASSTYLAVDKLTEAASPYIAQGCSEYAKAKATADAVVVTGLVPADIAAKITSIESFGDSACTSPPAGDPLSTAIWFGQLAGQLVTLIAK